MCDLERGRVLSSVHAHEDAVSGMAVQQGLLFSSSWDSMVKVGLLFVLLFDVSMQAHNTIYSKCIELL